MKKVKIASFNKKASIKNAKFSINYLLMLLTLVPLFFSAIFQGGYFPWETYLTFLLSVPAILLFIITKFKTNEPENGIRKSGADLSLLVFLVVCFLSLSFTVYFHTTLTEFFKVLIYLALFYIVLNTINGEKESNIIIYSALGLSVVLSILGLIGYVGYKLNLSTSLFAFASRYGFTQGDRIASTLQYSNTFAAFLLIPIFISFSGFIGGTKVVRKIIYAILSLLFLLTFILTQSRGALVAFAVAVIIYLILLKGKERKTSILTFSILLVGIIAVVLLRKDVFLPVIQSLFLRIKLMFSFFRGQWEESLGDRVYMLKDSLRILKDYPVLGTGNGTYQYVYAKYRTIYFFSKFPHSIFFQVLDEIGILGGAAFIYVIFSLFRKGFGVIKDSYSANVVGIYAGLLGVFLHALVDFDWSLMFMPLLFFFLFALLISQGKKEFFPFKCPLIERFSKKKQLVKNFKTFDVEKVHLAKLKGLGITLTIILAIVFLFQFFAAFSNFRAKGSVGDAQWQDTVSMFKIATSLDPLAAE
ncbi:MAG: O-antigen ligase family protein, partial [Fervidobacterium sp.]